MVTKTTVITILAMMAAVGVLGGAVVAQGPPDDAGPSENVTTGPPEDVAEFIQTSPLGPGQVEPNSLSGKIRVESQHVDNTTIELTNDTATNSSMDITVTGNATNVTFYLQKQAVEASQDIENMTVEVDGEPVEFGVAEEGGGNWVTFEVEHFSTRTVTFTSEAVDLPDSNPFSDADGPAERDKVVNRIVEWNLNDGVVGGTEYTREEMIDYIVEWNKASD